MHMMDALSEAKGSRHLSHPITAGLGVLSFLSYHVCKVFVEGCWLYFRLLRLYFQRLRAWQNTEQG